MANQGAIQVQQFTFIMTVATSLISSILSIVLNTLNIMVGLQWPTKLPHQQQCSYRLDVTVADIIIGLSTIMAVFTQFMGAPHLPGTPRTLGYGCPGIDRLLNPHHRRSLRGYRSRAVRASALRDEEVLASCWWSWCGPWLRSPMCSKTPPGRTSTTLTDDYATSKCRSPVSWSRRLCCILYRWPLCLSSIPISSSLSDGWSARSPVYNRYGTTLSVYRTRGCTRALTCRSRLIQDLDPGSRSRNDRMLMPYVRMTTRESTSWS